MATRLEYHLTELNKKVSELHVSVIDLFMSSMKAFELLDQSMASEVKEKSEAIESMAENIEENVFETIARRQPVARDLRQLATYLSVVHHLYRIGRYAYKIAHIVRLCEGLQHFKELISLPLLARLAKETIDDAMLGIIKGDLSRIDEMEKLEAESDRETGEMFEEITEYLRKRTDITTMAMYYVIVGRYCERAADQGFAIAERAVYMVTGKRKKLGCAYKGLASEAPH
ncbi:MAG: phosphate uptake regulator PhoU [Promethearchaeota archaeon]